ncbi:SDR family oxidoreductase [Pseudohoeflea coraliihabitans]|uniref:SDR family oxidoreductase n=1 Tax=Pseudohoeflea coraliihabitans TaxID=2860393 RepID=A0ABS6WUJ7_9HYPH|nr:SDR family oxidoreductase [Pseudohoeflea sp. DP4N28-3]MBW3098730.1 SDR family oxidoreductase [Pseudohoeflea sp. DP4N28-3]
MTECSAPIALVTGAAKRIGRAIAEDLGANGFAVAVHANGSAGAAEETAAAIRSGGGTAEVFIADLEDPDAVAGLVARVADRLGAPRLLVNNASIFEPDFGDAFDAALFDRHMAVHVKAPVALTAAMAEHLPAESAGGLVVNLIDQRVWKLTPQHFSYTLSKAALWTATRTLAMTHAPRLRVNAIAPGPTLPSPRQSEEDFARQVAAVPLQRAPDLISFGRTIRYLFDTPSVTGTMIPLDGGQHLAWETPDVAGVSE